MVASFTKNQALLEIGLTVSMKGRKHSEWKPLEIVQFLTILRRFNQLRYVRFLASSYRPNIIGFVANLAGDLGGTGPFINEQNAGTGWGPEDSRGNTRQVFNANAANYIYGASDTVQPRSLRFLPCIKF